MAKRHIDYGRLVEQALRTVVRDVLMRVAREGLIASHHFFITFRTTDPGVEITDYLRERYPTEMTIVIQYQYWDLQVDDEGFSVSLSFNNAPERLVIPFSAVKVFADPGAEFGLQFTIEPESRVVALPSAVATPPEPPIPLLTGSPGAGKSGGAGQITAAGQGDEAGQAAGPEAADKDAAAKGAEHGGAEIVTLDRFRKK